MPSIALFIKQLLSEDKYSSDFNDRISERINELNAAQLQGIYNHLVTTAKAAKSPMWASANAELVNKIESLLKERVGEVEKINKILEENTLKEAQKRRKFKEAKIEQKRVLQMIAATARKTATEAVAEEEVKRLADEKVSIMSRVYQGEERRNDWWKKTAVGFVIGIVVISVAAPSLLILIAGLAAVLCISLGLAYYAHLFTIVVPTPTDPRKVEQEIERRCDLLKKQAVSVLREKERKFEEQQKKDKLERKKRKAQKKAQAKFEAELMQARRLEQQQQAQEIISRRATTAGSNSSYRTTGSHYFGAPLAEGTIIGGMESAPGTANGTSRGGGEGGPGTWSYPSSAGASPDPKQRERFWSPDSREPSFQVMNMDAVSLTDGGPMGVGGYGGSSLFPESPSAAAGVGVGAGAGVGASATSGFNSARGAPPVAAGGGGASGAASMATASPRSIGSGGGLGGGFGGAFAGGPFRGNNHSRGGMLARAESGLFSIADEEEEGFANHNAVDGDNDSRKNTGRNSNQHTGTAGASSAASGNGAGAGASAGSNSGRGSSGRGSAPMGEKEGEECDGAAPRQMFGDKVVCDDDVGAIGDGAIGAGSAGAAGTGATGTNKGAEIGASLTSAVPLVGASDLDDNNNLNSSSSDDSDSNSDSNSGSGDDTDDETHIAALQAQISAAMLPIVQDKELKEPAAGPVDPSADSKKPSKPLSSKSVARSACLNELEPDALQVGNNINTSKTCSGNNTYQSEDLQLVDLEEGKRESSSLDNDNDIDQPAQLQLKEKKVHKKHRHHHHHQHHSKDTHNEKNKSAANKKKSVKNGGQAYLVVPGERSDGGDSESDINDNNDNEVAVYPQAKHAAVVADREGPIRYGAREAPPVAATGKSARASLFHPVELFSSIAEPKVVDIV
jgi:hypothetical protein